MAGTLRVTASNGDTIDVAGVSITGSVPEPRPIVVAKDLGFDETCNRPPLPLPGTFKHDEIVVCERGNNATLKSSILADAGASALVIYNYAPFDRRLNP